MFLWKISQVQTSGTQPVCMNDCLLLQSIIQMTNEQRYVFALNTFLSSEMLNYLLKTIRIY